MCKGEVASSLPPPSAETLLATTTVPLHCQRPVGCRCEARLFAPKQPPPYTTAAISGTSFSTRPEGEGRKTLRYHSSFALRRAAPLLLGSGKRLRHLHITGASRQAAPSPSGLRERTPPFAHHRCFTAGCPLSLWERVGVRAQPRADTPSCGAGASPAFDAKRRISMRKPAKGRPGPAWARGRGRPRHIFCQRAQTTPLDTIAEVG